MQRSDHPKANGVAELHLWPATLRRFDWRNVPQATISSAEFGKIASPLDVLLNWKWNELPERGVLALANAFGILNKIPIASFEESGIRADAGDLSAPQGARQFGILGGRTA